ncbi:MAG: sulfite exporter TauE/SafE family protein [Pseudomonadota bacterium]
MAALLMVWPGALAIGLSLGLLGSGGSILTVPVLVFLLGQDEKVAIAGSLAIVGLIAAAGSVSYLRDRLVDWRCAVLFGVPGMAGTYLGACSSAFVSGTVQLATFALVVLAASAFMLRPPAVCQQRCEANAAGGAAGPNRAAWRITIDGLVVGAVTGFVGVGGGFLIVPALVLLGGLAMHRAVGTSLVIIAAKSAVGFFTYQSVLASQSLEIDYKVIAVVTAFGVAGTLLGNTAARHLSMDRLRQTFGCFLIAMGVYVLSLLMPPLLSATLTAA